MALETRNPYLVLGIPFGAGRERANVAFARRNRALPADPAEARARRTDLTWALQQIDQGPTDPEAELTLYRIPADLDAMTVDGEGVFAPPTEIRPAADDEVDAAVRQVSAAAAREHLRRFLAHRAERVRPPAP